MASNLIPIGSDRIEEVWPHIEEFVSRGLEHSGGLFWPEDIKKFCLNRNMQLWVSVNDEIFEACLVTQIVCYPRTKLLIMVLVGGSGLRNWVKFESLIAEWGRRQGCNELEACVRKGWLRVLMGWRPSHTLIRKEL